jgi:hypothetical protein
VRHQKRKPDLLFKKLALAVNRASELAAGKENWLLSLSVVLYLKEQIYCM